ncbi:NACHT domain-containing protein [Actinocorallia libanotica]|uniref:NACHT domain-containing protein n=1 Tax=Actinocorallia libanotica TaxID=46162 RepID=A0ABN1RVT3_9ACTN
MAMMGIMGGERWAWRVAVGACVLTAVMVVASTWDEWKTGQVDPGSASIALMALALAVLSGRQASTAARIVEDDTTLWAARLAEEVMKTESSQRRQLLGEDGNTIDVAFTFTPSPSRNARVPDAQGSLNGVVHYFQNSHPRRLVITGEGGSGKTLLALELILGLLDPQVRKPEDPVPVRVSAATWDPQIPVQEWLAAQLASAFPMAPATARRLVETGRILPVIDGLDEMDAETAPGRPLGYDSAASQAIRALNTYQQSRERPRLVLTCRTGQYDDLIANRVWAHDTARINLQPVEAAQAARFIRTAVTGTHDVNRWRPVLDSLTQPSHPVAQALSTPWRLRLAVTVYTQRDPADLVAFTHPDALRDHLLSLYIPAATAAQGPGRYRPEQVHAWLAVLARHLNDNTTRPPVYGRALSGTDLILHQLWPLAGRLPHHLTTAFAFALILILTAFMSEDGILWFAILPPAGVFAAAILQRDPWKEPKRLKWTEWTQLKTRYGRRRFTVGLVIGLLGGLAAGLALALTDAVEEGLARGFASGLELMLDRGLDFGLTFGLAFGLTLGPAVGLTAGLTIGAVKSGVDPREPLRSDFFGWLVGGLAFGLALESALWPLMGLETDPSHPFVLKLVIWLVLWLCLGLGLGLIVGLAVGLAVGLTGGPAAVRYGMLLLCTRGRLPRRLGRFLHWCYQTGLLRTSGVAYQFRHRELQDYLAAHPFP